MLRRGGRRVSQMRSAGTLATICAVAALAGCSGDRSGASNGSATPVAPLPAGAAVGAAPDDPSLPSDVAPATLRFVAAPDLARAHGGRPILADGDFDEDGRDDLLLGASDGVVELVSAARALRGEPAAPLGHVEGLDGLVVADLDGDQHLDVAVSVHDRFGARTRLWLGDGRGRFAAGGVIARDAVIAAGHFTGAAGADLVFDGGATLLPNLGAARFGDAQPTGVRGDAVTVGDFDGDGDDDLAVAAAGHVDVALGRGDGRFAPPVTTPATPTTPTRLWSGDFDGDGLSDVAIASVATSGALGFETVTVLHADGDGQFAGVLATTSSARAGGGAVAAVADFDGDGRADLAVGLADRIDLFAGRLRAPMAPATSYPLPAPILALFAGDLDGDGHRDLLGDDPDLLWLRNVTR